MAAAAVIAARHNRKKRGGSLDGAERRRRFAQKLANDQRRAEELFDDLDVRCRGVISESQVETLLAKLLRKKLPADAMDYVWRELAKAQRSPSFSLRSLGLGAAAKPKGAPSQEAKRVNSGQTTAADESTAQASEEPKSEEAKPLLQDEGQAEADPQEAEEPDTETYFSRAAVLNVVTKVRYYLSHANDVEEIYRRFDSDHDNFLDAKELQQALQYIEDRDGQREKYGMIVSIPVTSDDVLWVLAQCDVSGNGRISRDEAIPAMAMWHALADRNFARQSQCCELQ